MLKLIASNRPTWNWNSNRLRWNITKIFRYGTTSQSPKNVNYEFPFSVEESEKILTFINQSPIDDISEYNISKTRALRLDHYRKENGKFVTLDNMLNLEGFGPKVIENFCQSVLTGETKLKKKFNWGITPTITKEQKESIKNVVGLQVNFQMVAWANVESEGRLLDWGRHKWELGAHRNHISEIYKMVQDVVSIIPPAELYILEDMSTLSQQNVSFIAWHIQQLQAKSMILALLNSQTSNSKYPFCVVLMKPSMIWRTFPLRVGSEKISGQELVLELLSGERKTHFPDFVVSDDLRQYYSRLLPVECEMLCQALFLPLTYWHLALE